MTDNLRRYQEGLAELQREFESQCPKPKLENSRVRGLINILKLKKRVRVLKELYRYIESLGPDINERLNLPDGPRAEQLLDEQWRIVAKLGVTRP